MCSPTIHWCENLFGFYRLHIVCCDLYNRVVYPFKMYVLYQIEQPSFPNRLRWLSRCNPDTSTVAHVYRGNGSLVWITEGEHEVFHSKDPSLRFPSAGGMNDMYPHSHLLTF